MPETAATSDQETIMHKPKVIKPLTDARLDELAVGSAPFASELKIIDQLRALPFEDRLAHWNKISFFGPATY